jgi:hypothetical protein
LSQSATEASPQAKSEAPAAEPASAPVSASAGAQAPAAGPKPPAAPVRRSWDRQVRYARILGLVFAAAGFATIGFGWNGTAKNAFIDKQIPYLLSGGAAGLGLVLLGIGLLVLAQFRNERLKLGEQLEHVAVLISKAVATGPGGIGSSNGRVVAGRSTYHRPDCRLVQGKADLDFVPVETAKLSGLSPCRVCNPSEGDTGESGGSSKRSSKRSGKRASSRR